MAGSDAVVRYRSAGEAAGPLAIAGFFVLVLLLGAAIGGDPAFLVFGGLISAGACYYALVLTSYEATLSPDGLLEFHGVLRHRHTTVDAVRTISVTYGESGRSGFKIRFHGGAVRIGHKSGVPLVRELLARNPAITMSGRARDL